MRVWHFGHSIGGAGGSAWDRTSMAARWSSSQGIQWYWISGVLGRNTHSVSTDSSSRTASVMSSASG